MATHTPETTQPLSESRPRHQPTTAYRVLPIFSAVVIPFSILLAVPSVTGDWHTVASPGTEFTNSEPFGDPPWLKWSMGASLACAVLANACLVVRFAERGVKLMTILSIVFLTVHDLISIVVLALFAKASRSKAWNDYLTLGQPFWMTLCATLASCITSITLLLDYLRTPNFANSGSGLTQKQRSLVIIVIILLSYIAFGSLIQSYLLNLTFIDALYFTVVSIETIGFGDIHPHTTPSRTFTLIHTALGILTLAVAVAQTREALLESAVLALQARVRRAAKREREARVRARWGAAVRWHLEAEGAEVWVPVRRGGEGGGEGEGGDRAAGSWCAPLNWLRRQRRRPSRDPSSSWRLNVEALSARQMEAAALEAGAPLEELLGSEAALGDHPLGRRQVLPPDRADEHLPLTHVRMGNAIKMLGSFGLALAYGGRAAAAGGVTGLSTTAQDEDREARPHRVTAHAQEGALASLMLQEERMAFCIRLGTALTVFFAFWLIGAVVFMKAEDWSFGIAVYFCFVTFTTVGYGDLTPKTPAGRSIFVAWALLGVAAMTTLLSILTEAYSERYKQAIQAEIHVYQPATGRVQRTAASQCRSDEATALLPLPRAGPPPDAVGPQKEDWTPEKSAHGIEIVASLGEGQQDVLRHVERLKYLVGTMEEKRKRQRGGQSSRDAASLRRVPLDRVRETLNDLEALLREDERSGFEPTTR